MYQHPVLLSNLAFWFFKSVLFYCFLLTHLTLKELDPNQPQKLEEDQKRVGTERGFAVLGSRQESCAWHTVVGGEGLCTGTAPAAWRSLTPSE